MNVLVACECSGTVRNAFRALGHNAWSCDIEPDENDSEYHLQTDVLEVLDFGWDLAICHPPCTYLCVSGLHWNVRRPGRAAESEKALDFVRRLMDAPIHRIAIENPVGLIGSRIRPADQYVQPYEYGDDASKRTGLWLKNLPLLKPTAYVEPRMVDGRPRWANQTPSGQNKLGPSPRRAAERARTYAGIAAAMAEQWGSPGLE